VEQRIIPSAAYFKPCQICGVHGHIVSSCGRRSKEFCSQEIGLRTLEEGVERGYILGDEIHELRRQIFASSLSRVNADADALTKLLTESCDVLRGVVREARRLLKKEGKEKSKKKDQAVSTTWVM
jgi:hypothetical protein